jgi:flavin reductase (DIM6/NTAB) family NADH-FMN oxidoreductase RutF
LSDPVEPESSTPFDSARFRQVLGHFPTGVTVITAVLDGEPVGMAVGSFASVSLEPPLVMFCAGHSSSTWPKLREAGTFCVNVLADNQEDISRTFASKGTDKFGGIGWRHSMSGAPILDGVLAWLDCDLVDVVAEGDHDIAVGAVRSLEVAHEGSPLIFFRGGYGRFAP